MVVRFIHNSGEGVRQREKTDLRTKRSLEECPNAKAKEVKQVIFTQSLPVNRDDLRTKRSFEECADAEADEVEQVVFTCELGFSRDDVVGEHVVEAACCGLQEGRVGGSLHDMTVKREVRLTLVWQLQRREARWD